MRHEIHIPDSMRGRELRTVVWDDEAGTVDGTHYRVPRLRELLAEPTPLRRRNYAGVRVLRDPAHRAEDFLVLLHSLAGFSFELPESLRDVEPTGYAEVYELPDGSVA